ncbi:hypothetical protein [Peribacillus sp. NPDC096540]|uniref:hypothetical protein n=1 Tax=Peribacillus sp. NPDC096540 TaxID=3390612 RepID=UPI003CFF5F48
MMKRLNKEGSQQIRSIVAPPRMEVSIDIVQEWAKQGIVIDTRPAGYDEWREQKKLRPITDA